MSALTQLPGPCPDCIALRVALADLLRVCEALLRVPPLCRRDAAYDDRLKAVITLARSTTKGT